MTKWVRVCCLLLLFNVGCEKESSQFPNGSSYRYQPGQLWTYHTRPGEESSRVIILKVDRDEKLGHIIHIRIEGVLFEKAQTSDLQAGVISHMPFSEEAVDKSMIDLISSDREVPDYHDGYQIWTRASEEGKVSVYTSPIADQIDEMEKSLVQ